MPARAGRPRGDRHAKVARRVMADKLLRQIKPKRNFERSLSAGARNNMPRAPLAPSPSGPPPKGAGRHRCGAAAHDGGQEPDFDQGHLLLLAEQQALR